MYPHGQLMNNFQEWLFQNQAVKTVPVFIKFMIQNLSTKDASQISCTYKLIEDQSQNLTLIYDKYPSEMQSPKHF